MNEKLTMSTLSHSENSASKTTPESFILVEKNNCTIHILLLYIVLAISTVITITAIYTTSSSKLVEPVDKESTIIVNYENASLTPFDCNVKLSPPKDWYFLTPYSPSYSCDPFKIVSNINIQPLRVRGHECNNTDNCYDLVRFYLGIMEEHSKFGFFIDSNRNVYGGRRWSCPFLAGQIWVAVMLEGFGAASQTEKERILSHFMEGAIPHEEQCVVSKQELKFNYFEEVVI